MSKSARISAIIILVSISSILQWCSLPIGNTYLWWAVYLFVDYSLIKLKPKGYQIGIISLFLLMVGLSALYGGLFQAHIYWDYKSLFSNLFIFSLPLAAYAFSSPKTLSFLLNRYFYFIPILFSLLCLFFSSDAYGRLLYPFAIIMLFLPFLHKRSILPILLAYLIVVFWGGQSRSYLLKFAFCLVVGLSLLLFKYQSFLKYCYRIAHIVLLSAPLILGILAVTGNFNVFRLDETLGTEGKYMMEDEQFASGESSIFADTRSFIYVEEVSSAINHHYLVQGRSIARGYESDFFGTRMDEAYGNLRGERYSSEVSILNIFNYFGLIGVVIYTIVFILATVFALYKSTSTLIKAVGVYVSFCYAFAWIEDFARVDLNTMFLWILIGMCFSPRFRGMTDKQFIIWIKSIRVMPKYILPRYVESKKNNN